MTNDKAEMMRGKKFDLEERTLQFCKGCIDLCKPLTRNILNAELIAQLIRASGSTGANYREANDSTTRKEFFYRIGICRKEAKESQYWLELLLHSDVKLFETIGPLIQEAHQLIKIFAKIAQSNT